MTIDRLIHSKGITEVVHFTTSHGCLGMLYTKMALSRQRLGADEMVRYLFSPNASLRKDQDFIDYVNLSIGHINHDFFNISSMNWHKEKDIFWCIMSFAPDILNYEGVIFSTTNNIYPSVRRGSGADGLAALYGEPIIGRYGNVVRRPPGLRSDFPTCFQAEALYPAFVPTDHLRRIYVRNISDQSEVLGFLKATFHRDVDVLVDSTKFDPRPQ